MSETQNATPAETLERHITDPCIPKSEAEWWAHREIERQRADNERLREAIQSLAERLEVDPSGTDKIDDLEAEVERLRADLLTQQGCCDGAAAQDAHIRQERDEARANPRFVIAERDATFNLVIAQRDDARAEVERLRADRRERIATAALEGLLSKWGGPPQQGADLAIQYADALIAELDKEDGKS